MIIKITTCAGDCRGDGKTTQERDAGYTKDGASLGKSAWAEISADVPGGENRQQCRSP